MEIHRAPERGEILLCRFPFDERPELPGPHPHFCLVVDSFEYNDQVWVAVAYGTSRNDQALQKKHPVIFDIRADAIVGSELTAPVTHILCDRLALLPWSPKWFKAEFRARINNDPQDRERSISVKCLQTDWSHVQKTLDSNLNAALKNWARKPKAGLVSGNALR